MISQNQETIRLMTISYSVRCLSVFRVNIKRFHEATLRLLFDKAFKAFECDPSVFHTRPELFRSLSQRLKMHLRSVLASLAIASFTVALPTYNGTSFQPIASFSTALPIDNGTFPLIFTWPPIKAPTKDVICGRESAVYIVLSQC